MDLFTNESLACFLFYVLCTSIMNLKHFRKKAAAVFEYDTPKMVHIESKRIGITHRILQTVILSYIIGYVIYYQKGYQIISPITSAVTTKVKGVTYTNVSIEHLDVLDEYKSLYTRIWDPVDYVIPTSGAEYGGFFITTNVIMTPNQSRGICAESHTILDAHCKTDKDCPAGESVLIGNGVFTGKCVKAPYPELTQAHDISTCEILAWCPVEFDEPPIHRKRPLLKEAENFTVLVKNAIEFPLFGPAYKRRNILDDAHASYLRTCNYDSERDPYCPVFKLGDVVRKAGHVFSEVAVKGAVFVLHINWDCDLDLDFEEHCKPKYSFERMDSPKVQISPGYNFRTAEYHEENRRTLYKHFGIKFLVAVTGKAGKFNLVPFFIHLGSGMAILGLANIFCDFLVLRCMKNRDYFKEKKYLVIRGPPEAFNIETEDHDPEDGFILPPTEKPATSSTDAVTTAGGDLQMSQDNVAVEIESQHSQQLTQSANNPDISPSPKWCW